MNNKTSQMLCVGSVAYDSIITPFGKVDKTLGGSAVYFSLASSLFAPTSIVGVVGNDFSPPDGGFDVFKKHKIDISGIEQAEGKTFHWAGKYHFDLNTRDTLKTELGVFAGFKPKLDSHHKNAKYVFLGNIQPKLQLDVLAQIKSANRRTELVGLDTMNLWIETALTDLKAVMKKVDLLVINDSEARQLSKEHNLLKAARKIFTLMNPLDTFTRPRKSVKLNPILIIKQGEHGLLLFHRELSLRAHPKQSNPPKRLPRPSDAPASSAGPVNLSYGAGRLGARNDLKVFNLPGYPPEDVIDPTGAGDSFAGALMGYLAKTEDLSPANLKKACAVASTIASFTVENFGTKRLQSIKLSDVNQRLAEYKKLVNF